MSESVNTIPGTTITTTELKQWTEWRRRNWRIGYVVIVVWAALWFLAKPSMYETTQNIRLPSFARNHTDMSTTDTVLKRATISTLLWYTQPLNVSLTQTTSSTGIGS